MKTIQVIITPAGQVQIEALGFKGQACEQATAELEKSLGATTGKKRKPEYFAATTAQQKAGAS